MRTGDRRGFQTGTFVPIREKVQKSEYFRQNSCYFPAILVAYYTSASGFEPVRSGFRFHSGPGVHPLHPAIDAWREMKPGGA